MDGKVKGPAQSPKITFLACSKHWYRSHHVCVPKRSSSTHRWGNRHPKRSPQGVTPQTARAKSVLHACPKQEGPGTSPRFCPIPLPTYHPAPALYIIPCQTWRSKRWGSLPCDITELVAKGALQTRPLGGGEQSTAAQEARLLLPITLALHGSLGLCVLWAAHKRRCRAAGRRGRRREALLSWPGPTATRLVPGTCMLRNGHGSRPRNPGHWIALFRAGDKSGWQKEPEVLKRSWCRD